MSTVVWPHRASPLLRGIKTLEFSPVFEKVGGNAESGMRNAEHQARMGKELTNPEPRISGPDALSPEPATRAATTRTIRIVMAGGGTGGHLYPGLAVAEALTKELGSRLELIWAATPRTVDQRLLGKFGDRYVQQAVKPLEKRVGKLWGFYKAWRESCAYWRESFAAQKADAVLALGGYAAGPAAYVAGEFGIPVALLNPDALPGLANRFLLKRADRVFSQWELSPALTKHVRGRVMPLGCPIRTDMLLGRDRAAAVESLKIDRSKKTLVVTGASLGAKTINDAVTALLGDRDFQQAFDRDTGTWQIVHLTGLDQAAAVAAAYDKSPRIAVKVVDYCDDMGAVWAVADLAIARAGASTCAELLACHVPAILMPYPFHRDNHQKENALQLVRAGAAKIVDDAKEGTKNALAVKETLLALLYDQAAREQMVEAALVAAKPHASAAIARELLTLIRQ